MIDKYFAFGFFAIASLTFVGIVIYVLTAPIRSTFFGAEVDDSPYQTEKGIPEVAVFVGLVLWRFIGFSTLAILIGYIAIEVVGIVN